MIFPLTTQKQYQRRRCLRQSTCLVRRQIVTLPIKSLACSFLFTPLIQTDKSTFLKTGFPFRKNSFSRNKMVSHAAAFFCAFMQLPYWVGKVVKMWVKQRLWERPFWGAKLRQQGRPTIFPVDVNPTISRFTMRFKQEIRFAAISAGSFPLPQFTPVLRGTHDR